MTLADIITTTDPSSPAFAEVVMLSLDPKYDAMPGWTCCHRDNTDDPPRYRKASVFDMTVTPVVIRDGDPPEFGQPDTRPVVGWKLPNCYWSEALLADIENPPAELPQSVRDVLATMTVVRVP